MVYQSKTYVVRNIKSVFTCGGFKVCKYSILLHTIIFEVRLKKRQVSSCKVLIYEKYVYSTLAIARYRL